MTSYWSMFSFPGTTSLNICFYLSLYLPITNNSSPCCRNLFLLFLAPWWHWICTFCHNGSSSYLQRPCCVPNVMFLGYHLFYLLHSFNKSSTMMSKSLEEGISYRCPFMTKHASSSLMWSWSSLQSTAKKKILWWGWRDALVYGDKEKTVGVGLFWSKTMII